MKSRRGGLTMIIGDVLILIIYFGKLSTNTLLSGAGKPAKKNSLFLKMLDINKD